MPLSSAAFAPPLQAGAQQTLLGLGRAELADRLAALGEKPFRARQLWQWIYHHGVGDFAQMSSLPQAARALLAEHFHLARPTVSAHQISADGTQKWLLRLSDGNEIESVFIPEVDRGTLCISSQVGCTLSCRFCHTGTQRLVRNLSAAEIVGQVLNAKDALGDWPASRPDRSVTNVVLMGMGEPLYNYDNVARAVRVLLDDGGLKLSRRRVTLSTSGVVPLIRRAGEELGVSLAISLHATTDELRDRIMPINKKYPLAELLQACREYPGVHNARRITFEYVMLKGVNDGDEDARRLVELIADIPAKVNLIPFNPWPNAPYERSDNVTIERFAQIVRDAGYPSPVRTPRGEDILAACGQLKSASERPRRAAAPVAP
ncbi:MAG: 23S rRNA (adenine(2503)-C(2))-methyltransferase RlmN [Alphaproteobacteria bacterium]|nr:23S rRNA (adenine(2503)-C(2))-methyltransferase RlmN [Alphaproteobacteria bacterium]